MYVCHRGATYVEDVPPFEEVVIQHPISRKTQEDVTYEKKEKSRRGFCHTNLHTLLGTNIVEQSYIM